MKSKKCTKCKRILSELNFNWKRKNVLLASHCRDCSREYIRNHYKNNLGYYLTKAKRRNTMLRHKALEYVGLYLSNHFCVDCGERDILVLEFDHKDRETKSIEINKIIRQRHTFEKLIQEISKCEVRCANCHRRKTEKESNSWKLKYSKHP